MNKECTKIKFTEYNFLELFVAVLEVNNLNPIIDKFELEEILADCYDKSEFKILFGDIIRKVKLDYNHVDLNDSFLKAQTWGLLQLLEDSSSTMKYIINISKEQAEQIIKSSDTAKMLTMFKLVENINSIRLYKDKDESNFNRMVTSEECSDRTVRWAHNINALKHDTEAQMAMMAVREERLNEMEKQDLECLRKFKRNSRKL